MTHYYCHIKGNYVVLISEMLLIQFPFIVNITFVACLFCLDMADHGIPKTMYLSFFCVCLHSWSPYERPTQACSQLEKIESYT